MFADAIDAIRVPRAQTKGVGLDKCIDNTDAIRVPRVSGLRLSRGTKSRTYGAWLSCVAGKSAIAI